MESSTYDITWTTPFCILTLKMTALVMDVYDGHLQVFSGIFNPKIDNGSAYRPLFFFYFILSSLVCKFTQFGFISWFKIWGWRRMTDPRYHFPSIRRQLKSFHNTYSMCYIERIRPHKLTFN